MLPLWPYVTTCDHLLPGDTKPIWHVTTCDQVIPNLLRAVGGPKKVTYPNQIWSVWTHVVIATTSYPLLLLTPVTQITHSSSPFQLFQLPIPVIPVTHSRYSSYPLKLFQLPTPVTPFIQSSHPLKLLQLPIPVTPVTPVTHSSYPLKLLQLPTPVTPVTINIQSFSLIIDRKKRSQISPPLHFPPQVLLGPDLVI